VVIWDKPGVPPLPVSESANTPAARTAPANTSEFISILGADRFFDAGNQGCGEGPLDKIAGIMRNLQPGQTLEVRATDPTVAVDLPAWCRMTGHNLLAQQQDRYLIQHKS
jgi:TusA-related sulfurtransferase